MVCCLLQLQPSSGPLEGGTALTVDGENLGLSINDTSVSVAGINCHTVEYLSAIRSSTLTICFHSELQIIYLLINRSLAAKVKHRCVRL